MRGAPVRAIVIAAGGTGGHFFPAEALGAELVARGHRIVLLTDARSGGENAPVFAGRAHVLRGAGIVGRGPRRAAAATLALAAGTLQARGILAGLNAGAIVGFGGYPSVPPVLAARTLRHRPRILLHEGNAVLGRANRSLARFADSLALGMPATAGLPRHTPALLTGNPVRPGIAARAGQPYAPPAPGGPIRLLVTGGSLGARIFGTAVPAGVALLPEALRARLAIVQQCRAEDLPTVRAAYAAMGVPAELSRFFTDMPDRLADAHLVVARAGASTVAELAAIGRPALLVPLRSQDSHQSHNAIAVDAGRLDQDTVENAPALLAEALRERLDDPSRLASEALAMARHGIPDAARRLADLVEQTILQDITA